jgi:hypothetical protein
MTGYGSYLIVFLWCCTQIKGKRFPPHYEVRDEHIVSKQIDLAIEDSITQQSNIFRIICSLTDFGFTKQINSASEITEVFSRMKSR